MQTDNHAGKALSLIKKHLQVQTGEPLAIDAQPEAGLEDILKPLTAQIAWLLDYQFERLLQAMYRIDIPEQDFRSALTGEAPVAPALAELVLQREIQKIETRERYSKGKAVV